MALKKASRSGLGLSHRRGPLGYGRTVPVPPFVLDLRRHVGHAPLWLSAASGIVLRERDGREQVLLVQRADNGRWTVPAGILDPGEEPQVAAVREVAEETGVTCRVERLAWVYTGPPLVHPNGDEAQYLEHVFTCSWVSGEPYAADDESTDAVWVDVDGLPEMIPEQRARVAAGRAGGPPWLGIADGLARAGE